MARILVIFLSVMLLSMFAVLTGHSQAVAGCAPNIGTRVPVELVHGWSSDGGIWTNSGSDSMVNVLDQLSNVYVDTPPFNYSAENQEWVTNQNIGPALAARIACLAQSSQQAGGLGKVIVVAHSMGGLATRYASSLVVDKQNVGSDVGLVVTLGTPNTGTDLASAGTKIFGTICEAAGLDGNVSGNNICALTAVDALQNNSPELRILPWLPTNTAVHSITGDVTVDVPLFDANVSINTGSDLIVGEGSALEGSAHTEEGGGQTVVACSGPIEAAIASLTVDSSLMPCWHSALPHNSTVEQDTVNAIESYIAANAPKPTIPKASSPAPSSPSPSTPLFPYLGTWNGSGGSMQFESNGYALYSGYGSGVVILYKVTVNGKDISFDQICLDPANTPPADWTPADFTDCNTEGGNYSDTYVLEPSGMLSPPSPSDSNGSLLGVFCPPDASGALLNQCQSDYAPGQF